MKIKRFLFSGFVGMLLIMFAFTTQVHASSFGDKTVVHYLSDIPYNWVIVGWKAPTVDPSNPNHTDYDEYTIMYIGGAKYGDIVEISSLYNIPTNWEIIDTSITLGGTFYKIQYKSQLVMKDLGELSACAINDKGQVVGYYINGYEHAFILENNKLIDLGTFRGMRSYATDINENYQVVGYYVTSDNNDHAFLWQNGKASDLGILGARSSRATGINDKGQVVGYYETSDDNRHAFLWENGKTTDLGNLGIITSCATGINDKGQVVGWSSTADSGLQHAFIWENGKMTDLGTLGGWRSVAAAINNNGQVVGTSETSDNIRHAFIWENGKMSNLDALVGDTSDAYGINDKGQIVGFYAQYSNLGGGHSFLNYGLGFMWENGKMTDLGTLSETYDFVNAYGINEKGQIVGTASDGNPPRIIHGFICGGDSTLYTDSTAPSIIAITPSESSILDANAKITVKAFDNVAVSSIKLQYSLDGIKWNDIETKNIEGTQNTEGTAEFTWDTSALKGSVKVRAIAVDTSGNESSNSPVYTYTIAVPKTNIGDVNSDGQINAVDYSILKGIILGTYIGTYNAENADMNGDKIINSMDCALLKRKMLVLK